MQRLLALLRVVPPTKPVPYPAAPLIDGPNAAPALKFVEFLQWAPALGVPAKHGFGKP